MNNMNHYNNKSNKSNRHINSVWYLFILFLGYGIISVSWNLRSIHRNTTTDSRSYKRRNNHHNKKSNNIDYSTEEQYEPIQWQYNQQRPLQRPPSDSISTNNVQRQKQRRRQQQQRHQRTPQRKHAKVLLGIFSADISIDEVRCRMVLRKLLLLYSPKVCTLEDYINYQRESQYKKQQQQKQSRNDDDIDKNEENDNDNEENGDNDNDDDNHNDSEHYDNDVDNTGNSYDDNNSIYECELIYTFVLGGNTSSTAPTEIVSTNTTSNSTDSALSSLTIVREEIEPIYSVDFNNNDMTFLNIRENMNTGKSQTWFYYASIVSELYNIEYIIKMDTDNIIYLDRYFHFAQWGLPPYPYHEGIIGGKPFTTTRWKRTKDVEQKNEHFFNKYYSTTHIYAAGQLYIFSRDIAAGIAYYLSNNNDNNHNNRNEINQQLSGHEDYDLSAIAFFYQNLALSNGIDQPIRFIMFRDDNPFWRHDVKIRKGVGIWKSTWDNEIERIRTIVEQSKQKNKSTSITSSTSTSTTKTPNEGIMSPSSRLDWFEQIKTFLNTNNKNKNSKNGKHNNKKDITGDVQRIINKLLNQVEIDNSIGSSSGCFLQSGQLHRPFKIVQFNADNDGTTNDNSQKQQSSSTTTTTTTTNSSSSQHPIHQYWNEFINFIQSKQELMNVDVFILNGIVEMIVDSSKNNNDLDDDDDDDDTNRTNTTSTSTGLMTTQKIAQALGMNYAWAMESITIGTPTTTTITSTDNENTIMVYGSAILSKCTVHDPLLVRNGVNTSHLGTNVDTSRRRTMETQSETLSSLLLSARTNPSVGLFVRTRSYSTTANSTDETGPNNDNYIVLGSINQLQPSTEQIHSVWGYLYNYTNDDDKIKTKASIKYGIPPFNQIGAIVAGDIIDRQLCPTFGLLNADDEKRRKTYPATCNVSVPIKNRFGTIRRDNFCSNMPYQKGTKDIINLPCFLPTSTSTSSSTSTSTTSSIEQETIQFSSHSLISMSIA